MRLFRVTLSLFSFFTAMLSLLICCLNFEFFTFFICLVLSLKKRGRERERERQRQLEGRGGGVTVIWALHTPRFTGYVCTPLSLTLCLASTNCLSLSLPRIKSVCMRFHCQCQSIAYVSSRIFNASFNILSLNLFYI